MTCLVAYLTFPGTTQGAMEFYHSIFGDEHSRSTFAEFGALPAEDPNAGKTMHAQLASGSVRLMAADHLPGIGPDVTAGNNISMALVDRFGINWMVNIEQPQG